MRKFSFIVLLLSCLSFQISAQEEKVDAGMIQKIRKEGLENSKVMDIAFHLTDQSGPRLTNSPGYYKAANWAISELKKWGLENSKLEPWGNFGKGWELQRSYLAMTAPFYKPIIAYPKAWTSGSGGLQTAEILLITAKDSIELMTMSGKLKGKIIMLGLTDTILKPSFKADAERLADTALQSMANYVPPTTTPARQGGGRGREDCLHLLTLSANSLRKKVRSLS